MRKLFGQTSRGLFVPFAVGIVIFLFILIMAFSYTVRSQRRSVYSIFKKEIALNLAEAGVEQASAYFNSGKSTLHGKLVDPSVTTASLPGMKESFTASNFPYLESVADQYGADVTVDMELMEGFKSLWDSQRLSGTLHDMDERVGQVLITVTVQNGDETWVKEAVKEIKVVNLLPSFLSKFTLFVTTPMADLNMFLNNQNGIVSDPADKRPLMLYHAPAGQPLDVSKHGWVFLGGGDWNFNLTSGWGKGLAFSEDFHYLAFNRVCVFDNTEPEHGVLDDDHVAKVVHRGFHQDLEITGLDQLLPATSGVRSNALHLFGSVGRTSPTLVLGRVYRRYVQYGALCCVDPDPLDTLYPPKVILKYVEPGNWPLYNQLFPEDPVNFPQYPAHGVKPDVFMDSQYRDPDPQRGFSFYMSRIIDKGDQEQGHYNNSYDMISQGNSWWRTPERKLAANLLDSRISPPAGQTDPDYFYSTDNGNETPGAGGLNVKMDNGTDLFKGNLNDAENSLVSDLDYKVFLEVTASEFKKMFIVTSRTGDSELNLGCVVRVTGSLHLDRPVTVKKGGLVLVDRSITISGGITGDAKVPANDAALTLCSRNGNIVVRTGTEIQAALVALKGSLIKDFYSEPLRVKGSVAVGSLDSNTLFSASTPGQIEYDPKLDPTDSANYEQYYRAGVLPREIVSKFYRKQ